jgi:putative heme iron utilization protein
LIDSFDELQLDIGRLLSEMSSVILATCYDDGTPLASYTPYFFDQERSGLWILVSELAGHAKNLRQSAKCSALVLRDEKESQQIYLRERCQYEMHVRGCDRSEPDWRRGCDGLIERHGHLIDTLEGLADFQLFFLAPVSGRYIVGFGRAFELKPGSLNQIDHHSQGPTGPQKES